MNARLFQHPLDHHARSRSRPPTNKLPRTLPGPWTLVFLSPRTPRTRVFRPRTPHPLERFRSLHRTISKCSLCTSGGVKRAKATVTLPVLILRLGPVRAYFLTSIPTRIDYRRVCVHAGVARSGRFFEPRTHLFLPIRTHPRAPLSAGRT